MTSFDLSIQEYADPDVILDPKKIRRKYILSWFFVDMISTIPLDYILQLIYGNVDPKGIYLTSIDPSWPQITLRKMITATMPWLQKTHDWQIMSRESRAVTRKWPVTSIWPLTPNDLKFSANSMRAMKLVRFAKILSLLRLLRLSRLIRYVHQWEEVLSTTSKCLLIGPFFNFARPIRTHLELLAAFEDFGNQLNTQHALKNKTPKNFENCTSQ